MKLDSNKEFTDELLPEVCLKDKRRGFSRTETGRANIAKDDLFKLYSDFKRMRKLLRKYGVKITQPSSERKIDLSDTSDIPEFLKRKKTKSKKRKRVRIK